MEKEYTPDEPREFVPPDLTVEGHLLDILEDIDMFQNQRIPCYIEVANRVELILPGDSEDYIRSLLINEDAMSLSAASVTIEYDSWKPLQREGRILEEAPDCIPDDVIDAFFWDNPAGSYSLFEDLVGDLHYYHDSLENPPDDFFTKAYLQFLSDLPEGTPEKILVEMVGPLLVAVEFPGVPEQAEYCFKKCGRQDLIEICDNPGERMRREAAMQFEQWTTFPPQFVKTEAQLRNLVAGTRRGAIAYMMYLDALHVQEQQRSTIEIVRMLCKSQMEMVRDRAQNLLWQMENPPSKAS